MAEQQPLEFVTFDTAEARRWWVVRGDRGAVSLTALDLTTTRLVTPDVTAPDGTRLLAECFTVHAPGDDTDCPALPTGCTSDGEALLGSRQVFLAWAAAGHDDAVIRAALEDLYAREVV